MSFLSVPISLRLLLGASRIIDTIEVNVAISENTVDTLSITTQPVQQGAAITDHAFKEPTKLSMSILFRDNLTKSLSKLYQDLLDLQISRKPFKVVTPKRIYDNMLISGLTQVTDKSTENCLSIQLQLQEIIIVHVTTAIVPKTRQTNSKITEKIKDAGKKSMLLKSAGG